MNLPMLKSYIEMAVTVMPWERVGAMIGSLILQAAKTGQPEVLAKVKRYISKARHQLSVIEASLADDRITADEARACLDAWAEGAPTPVEIEKKAGV